MVADAYRRAVGRKYGKPIRTPSLKTGSKTGNAAVKFLQLATELKKPLIDLMEVALGRYESSWCNDTFGRPFPPITVTISEKNQDRIRSNWKDRQAMTPEQLRRQARDIANTMKTVSGIEGALEILDGGWPEDESLRVEIRKFLQNVTD